MFGTVQCLQSQLNYTNDVQLSESVTDEWNNSTLLQQLQRTFSHGNLLSECSPNLSGV